MKNIFIKNQKAIKPTAIAIIVLILTLLGYFLISSALKQKIGYGGQKVYRVGILSGLNLFNGIADSFKDEMKNLGYVEGKNIIYDLQKTNYEPDKEKQILANFVDDKVNLIFGFNTEVALEAKSATKGTNIPVVFANAFTEGNDLIDNVREPGGNITGVRYPNTDVAVKRFQVLHEIVPNAKRFWLPYQEGYPSVPAELEVVRPVAESQGISLIEFPSKDLNALKTELQRLNKLNDIGFEAVLYIPESLSTTKEAFAEIAKVTKPRKIPVGGSSVSSGDYTTVFAVTIDNDEIGRLAASLADKILKGEKSRHYSGCFA